MTPDGLDTSPRALAPARTRPAAPVRIVHLGIGAFHRAHQAWYTAHAADADQWGIAGFTSRSPDVSDRLRAQDCAYTLVERSAERDRFETIESIVEAHPGDDTDSLVALLRRPEVAVVTLTVTEAGYLLDDDGILRLDDPVIAGDVRAVHVGREAGTIASVHSIVARLVVALRARFDEGASAVAVISCDNLPDNGRVLARACRAFADEVGPGGAGWLDEVAAFVCTSVDRITPRTTTEDEKRVRAMTGHADRAPVVTEPFTDWVLEGSSPPDGPAWESAGARFVSDIRPWELRKLRLLNGAHTLLAALGSLRGHATVDAAIRDHRCRDVVEEWWDEAARSLPDGLELSEYRASLLERFENPRIAHQLAQIGEDARAKLRIRIVPAVLHELENDREPRAGLTAIAAVLVREGVGGDEQDIQAALKDISSVLAERPGVVSAVAHIALRLEHPELSGPAARK